MIYSKPGRKPKGIGRRFATMAWFQALSLRTGLLTAGQMGKQYLPNQLSSENNSNIFYKYRDGSSFPSSNHLLIEMEHIDLEMLWLHGELFGLIDDRNLRETDLMMSFSSSQINDAVRGDYWKKGFNYLALREDRDWLEIFDLLRKVNDLDAFTATIMVLRQCRLARRLGFVYHYGWFQILDMWRIIYFHPVLGKFAENLYWYLENEFIPKHVKADIAGNEWLKVSEAHTLRIQSAQNELPGWTAKQATISSKWYKDLLHFYNWRQQMAKERAYSIYGSTKDVVQ
jgi:hypothetical protein